MPISRFVMPCLLLAACTTSSNDLPGDSRAAPVKVDASVAVDLGVDSKMVSKMDAGVQASVDGGSCAKLANALSGCTWYDATNANALNGCDQAAAGCILGLADACKVDDVLKCAYKGSDPDFAAVCLGDTAIWSDGKDSAAFGCGSLGSCRTCALFGAEVSGCSSCGGALPGSMTCKGNVLNWCAGCADKTTIMTAVDCSIDGTTCVAGQGCVKP
jgi:hypothetical protein